MSFRGHFEDQLMYSDEESSEDYDDEEEDSYNDVEEIEPEVVDVSPILCKSHKGKADMSCDHCKAVSALISKDQLALLLSGSDDKPDSVPDPASRFGKVKHEPPPSLVLSKTSMDFGKAVYSRGPMSQTNYKKVLKESLFLSPAQNKELEKNQQLEPMFEKYFREPRFKYVSKWVHLLINLNRINRIAQRPLLVAVSELDSMIRSVRSVGSANGFVFPDVAPTKKILSPTPVTDHTYYSSANPFPLPEFPNVLEGCAVEPDQQAVIEGNWQNIMTMLTEYQKSVSNAFIGLFDKYAESSIKLDDYLTFYFSLAAHNDAIHLSEARDVMSNMFKHEVRPYVQGKYQTNEEREEFNKNATGLLGGSKLARDRINSGVSEDDVIKKSILRKKVQFSPLSKGSPQGKRFRQLEDSPRKSFKDSASSRDSSSARSFGSGARGGFKGSNRGGRNNPRNREPRFRVPRNRDEENETDKEEKKTKSKFVSPQSFAVAWAGFFSLFAFSRAVFGKYSFLTHKTYRWKVKILPLGMGTFDKKFLGLQRYQRGL